MVRVNFNKPVLIPQVYQNISKARLEPNFTDNVFQTLEIKVLNGGDFYDWNRTKIVKFNLTEF